MKDLTYLADKWGTDRGNLYEGHLYTEIYKSYLPHTISPIMVEIGIKDPRFPGAGMKMWDEYFDNFKYYGFDIEETQLLNPNLDKFTLYQGDQSNPSDLIDFIDTYDLNDKYKIEFIDNTYGVERDALYNRTKVYVNIHCSEKHTTMELIRIINLLYNNVIVITQKSIFDKLLFVRNNLIICNNDEELEKYTLDILDNYKYYYNLFFNNESGYDKRLYFDKTYYEKYVLKNIECLLSDK